MYSFYLKSLTILCIVVLSACQTQGREDLPAFVVSQTDFSDLLLTEGTVESENSVPVNCPQGIDGTIVFLVEEGVRVEEGDIVCRLENAALATDHQEILASLEIYKANLQKTLADQAMEKALLEAEMLNNEAQKAISSLSEQQLEFIPENQRRIKELELQQAAIQNSRFEKKFRTMKIIHQTELRRQQMGIQRVEARVKQVEERIASLVLRAPRAGIVIRGVNPVNDRKYVVGDNAYEGYPILMLPEMEKMNVKIQATEAQYKRMKVGDAVEFSFDAQPENKAWGKIIMKAPVGQPINRNSKVKLFDVMTAVDSALSIPTPGMSARCTVILNQLKDTLVIPQIAVFDHDSTKVVYIQKEKGFERRQVTIGLSSPKEAVVVAGIHPGEIVSLMLPDDKNILKTVLSKDSTDTN